jgi:hypothetical protein
VSPFLQQSPQLDIVSPIFGIFVLKFIVERRLEFEAYRFFSWQLGFR